MIRTKHSVPTPAKKKKPGKPGRKGFYATDLNRQAYYLATLGAKDKQIAEFFNIDDATLDYWKKNKPEFKRELKRGKWEYDLKAVQSLQKLIDGYSYTEVEVAEHLDKFGNVHLLRKETMKQVPPSLGAVQFWLTNRQRDLWGNAQNKPNANPKGLSATETEKDDQIKKLKSIMTEKELEVFKSITIKSLSESRGNISNN